jgi:hypothetical protein
VWPRITWTQFERATKFLAGLVWGTLELALWGGRLVPLLFIGAVWGLTELGHAFARLREVSQ